MFSSPKFLCIITPESLILLFVNDRLLSFLQCYEKLYLLEIYRIACQKITPLLAYNLQHRVVSLGYLYDPLACCKR